MRILIVEDNPQDRELLVFALQEHFMKEAKFREVSDLESAHEYLKRGGVDAVVLDLQLPDSTGADTFTRIHNAYPQVPVIVVTHNSNLELAQQIIQRGAEDVIIKDFTNTIVLFRRILFAIERGQRNRAMWMLTEPPPFEDEFGVVEVPEDPVSEDPIPSTLPSSGQSGTGDRT
jgi:DNA-binding response OmpR family regulator